MIFIYGNSIVIISSSTLNIGDIYSSILKTQADLLRSKLLIRISEILDTQI